eukprot:scaffold76924_cov38-Prasinocladus_malaysianus.AAC.1
MIKIRRGKAQASWRAHPGVAAMYVIHAQKNRLSIELEMSAGRTGEMPAGTALVDTAGRKCSSTITTVQLPQANHDDREIRDQAYMETKA